MNSSPLVSIITPCYNSARYIRECIESVLAQNYPSVEHVIQDSASTDGTREIVEEYAACYPEKIRTVSEKDRGQADGLNRVIQRAQGEILLVLNADDALLPHACSWGSTQLLKHPDAGAVYGDEYIIDEHGITLETFIARPYDFEKVLCLELVPPAQASFIRRSALEQVGYYADARIDSCPDFEMWVRLGLQFPVYYEPGTVARYRHREGEGLQEGGITKTAMRFYHAKKLVQDRVFNSPRSAPKLRALKQRAELGLLMWTAAAHYGLVGGVSGILKNPFVYKSLDYALNSGQWQQFVQQGSRYLNILIKRLIYGRS